MNKIKYLLLAAVLAFSPINNTFAQEENVEEIKADDIVGADQPVEGENGEIIIEEYTDKDPAQIVEEEKAKGNDVVVYEDTSDSFSGWYILGATSVIAIGLIGYGVSQKRKKIK